MEQLQVIQSKIYEIRGQKVMLDFDLASMYGTETKYLKRSVKNNLKRFPSDFMFELSKEEWNQFAEKWLERSVFNHTQIGALKHGHKEGEIAKNLE